MKFYQNNKLVATLEKTRICLRSKDIKTKKIEMLRRLWYLKDDRGNLIDSFILDFETKTLNAKMLRDVCKKLKTELTLSDEEIEMIPDNQEELQEQRIVLDIKE